MSLTISPVYMRPRSGLIWIQSTYGRGLPNPDRLRVYTVSRSELIRIQPGFNASCKLGYR